MKDRGQRLRDGLSRISIPGEREAEERAWRLISAAHAERDEWQRPVRRKRRLLQIALVTALLVVVISPAGAAVRDWVADTVKPGKQPSKPVLTSLPTSGELLVQSPVGTWVVRADGSKRLLGNYMDAAWSPRGLYVAATTRHELAAVEPTGAVRWTLAGREPMRVPTWNAPDGFRITYLRGNSLRVVNGDGIEDRLLARRVARIAPTWQPGKQYILSFARLDGVVETVRTGTGQIVFATRPGLKPTSLQWSHDGRSLLVVRPTSLELLDRQGRIRWRWGSPRGSRIVTARLEPRQKRLALIVSTATRSRLMLIRPGFSAHGIFSGPGHFSDVEWSPDGRWLLLAWRNADQWLFLNPGHPNQIVAVSNITEQFSPGKRTTGLAAFPRIEGWCCMW